MYNFINFQKKDAVMSFLKRKVTGTEKMIADFGRVVVR